MARIAYSATVNNIRGKVGTNVFTAGRSGPSLRIRVSGKNPKSPPQRDVRGYFGRAAKAYESLDVEQARNWRNYAAGITHTNPVNGRAYSPAPINVFVQLASKFLQLNPTGTIPLDPPSSDFVGDSVKVSASVISTGLRFTATAPNAAGVTTEILLQPLPSPNRLPTANAYRHATFKAFASGNLTVDVEVPPGYYAAAYRFVRNATGQMTDPMALPISQVQMSVMPGSEEVPQAA
jgi:hypothetical protein